MNTIHGLTVNGNWVEEPAIVKTKIFNHFQKQFHEPRADRPSFESKKFKTLSVEHALSLENPFIMEEIQHAMWSFDGSKAPA